MLARDTPLSAVCGCPTSPHHGIFLVPFVFAASGSDETAAALVRPIVAVHRCFARHAAGFVAPAPRPGRPGGRDERFNGTA